MVDRLGLKLLEPAHHCSMAVLYAEMLAALTQYYMPPVPAAPSVIPVRLPPEVSVSVVVATYDRPEDLRRCLRCLRAQESPRQVDIIVVDNHPASGLTPPVMAEFPEVTLVCEPRQGSAYARNAGILASTGAIIVTTDDDVIVPADWLEKLLAPFVRNDVVLVTGNVLPLELETPAQHLFEAYGGFGRGFERLEVGREWFESFWPLSGADVETWRHG